MKVYAVVDRVCHTGTIKGIFGKKENAYHFRIELEKNIDRKILPYPKYFIEEYKLLDVISEKVIKKEKK